MGKMLQTSYTVSRTNHVYAEYYDNHNYRDWFYDLIKGDNQFIFVSEVPGPDDKIMVRLIDGILYIRGTGGFSKEVQIEGSDQMKISDFKY